LFATVFFALDIGRLVAIAEGAMREFMLCQVDMPDRVVGIFFSSGRTT